MKRNLIGLALALAFLLGGFGCNKVQVDCEKMCTRTFDECVGDVLVASKKVDEAKLEQLKKSGAIKTVKERGKKVCLKDCKKKKGFGGDSGAINKCLEKKDCKEYGGCIKKHLK